MLEFTQIGYLEDPLRKCLEIAEKHPLRPCLFVGSSDDEVSAFVAAASELQFVQPIKDTIYDGMQCLTKRAHLAHLLSDGKNVAIKGSLFNYCDDAMLKMFWYSGYSLISTGDSIYWSDKIKNYNAANIDEAIRRKQLIPVAQETFLLSPAHKEKYVLEMTGIDMFTYNDRLLTRLAANGKAAMYWTPQPQFVDAFQSIHIVHHMPAASPLAAYLQVFGIQPELVEGSQEQNRQLAALLNVVLDERHNEKGTLDTAYSMRWFNKSGTLVDEVFKDMRNVLIHTDSVGEKSSLVAYALPTEILDGTKDDQIRSVFRGRGFPAISAAMCEDYLSACVLCYCVNTYFPAACNNYFRNNKVSFDQDAYALHHMLRWISRSAVRAGTPATVYVPSMRMRDLLVNWIEQGGN